MKILAVNAGSGSMKVAIVDGDSVVLRDGVDAAPDGDEATALLDRVVGDHGDVDAVGHRIVHGGSRVLKHVVVDDGVRTALDEARSIDPVHVPAALAALDTCRDRLPQVPHVACLDTAFHASMPRVASTYAVPAAWREQYGVRRYGFHGLSYAWATDRAAELLERDVTTLAMVIVHAGGGTSTCAVLEGRSVWTSMGFTPLEGAAMVGRSGSVDPGMLLWLLEQGLSVDQIRDGVSHGGGMTGLSGGLGGDTRDLHRAAAGGDPDARLALDVYIHRLRQETAAAAACLPRLDALVLTGDIADDDREMRQGLCDGLATLGLDGPLDDTDDEGPLRVAAGRPTVLLVRTAEDRQIARICAEVL